VLGLNHSKQVQYDEDESNNEQGVNPAACLRDPLANVPAEKAEQPQNEQNDDDCPQHEISPSLMVCESH
jgi:hypothetical protein